MRANRTPRARADGFRRDERGVSEAVGYMITFGVSTIVLVTALQAFFAIRQAADSTAVDRTVREVAAQVVFAVEQGLKAGKDYPDADFTMAVPVPRSVHGVVYRVELYSTFVHVWSADALPAEQDANGDWIDVRGRSYLEFVQVAGVTVHCNGPGTVVTEGTCRVESGSGTLTVAYGDPGVPAGRGVYFKP